MSRSRGGFTFVEVLVSLVIVASLLSVVAVSATSMFSARLRSDSGKILALIRYTYDRAIIKGKPHQLVFDLDDGKVWIETAELDSVCKQGTSGEEQDEMAGKKASVYTLELDTGISFDGLMTGRDSEKQEEGKGRIFFFPDGTAEKAFVWLSRDEDVFTIEVKALQGKGVLRHEELEPSELAKR